MSLKVADSFPTHRFMHIRGYTHDMYYVLTFYYHDSCNKRQCTPLQIMFQCKFTISIKYITRTHTQMRSGQEEKKRGKEMKRDRKEDKK